MKPMNTELRLISFTTLFLAVLLPSIALFALNDKNLARVVFVVVIVTGYGYAYLRWRRQRQRV